MTRPTPIIWKRVKFYSLLPVYLSPFRLEQAFRSMLMPSVAALNPVSWQLEWGRMQLTSSPSSWTRGQTSPLSVFSLSLLLINCLQHVSCLAHLSSCSTTCRRSSKALMLEVKWREVLVLQKLGPGCFTRDWSLSSIMKCFVFSFMFHIKHWCPKHTERVNQLLHTDVHLSSAGQLMPVNVTSQTHLWQQKCWEGPGDALWICEPQPSPNSEQQGWVSPLSMVLSLPWRKWFWRFRVRLWMQLHSADLHWTQETRTN